MPDYTTEKATAIDFLQHCEVDGDLKYRSILQGIANRDRSTLEIELDDLAEYAFGTSASSGKADPNEFVANVETNTQQYLKLFAQAADDCLPEPSKPVEDDVYDVLQAQRQRGIDIAEQNRLDNGLGRSNSPNQQLPPALVRRFEVLIKPRSGARPLKMREVQSASIGHLVTVRGIVTNATDVKPLLTVATYLDTNTGIEVYQEITGRTFTPVDKAPDSAGAVRGVAADLVMQTRGSKFVRFQEVRIQELASEVPQGATPRTMVVHLMGALTRSVKPGDAVTLSGIFLPEPFTGFRAARAGLLTNTYLLAQAVSLDKRSYQSLAVTPEQQAVIAALEEEGDVYDRLARSIAPEIWGHEDVKKALLLVLVGGVTKEMDDGMKLRGDIHACLMGDPGVAKSQLLRYVCNISPRAVYTTGKGSSGVGLTAAVTKDPMTGEMMLEGGALVLADKGICAIDEFDKMEESDRTAIHEVMEQQTVSIAKAGITTTLNTRTTVLAAANPAWGRYDTRRSPSENIALPAALLSRFDLLWLILDRADDQMDRALATHVLAVHKEGRAPKREGVSDALTPDELRAYIAEAKQHQPFVPTDLTEYIAAVYAEMRTEEAQTEQPHSYTTARTLLSILRLSQALARLRLDDIVTQSDVDEALRLMRMSKISLTDEAGGAGALDAVSAIYSRVRDDATARRKATYTWAELTALSGQDYSHEEVKSCVEEYAAVGIWDSELSAAGEPVVTFAEACRPWGVS